MCAVAQKSSEHQGSSELPRIPIPRTPVNRGLSSLLCRLTPQPRGPSRNNYGPPDEYKLAYSVPCANPYQHLPKEAPRVQDAPVHVADYVTPKSRVLPALQVRVPYNQHGSQDSGHERGEHSQGEPPTPHQVGRDY